MRCFIEGGGGDPLSGGQPTGGGTILQTSWARFVRYLIDEGWSWRRGCGGGDRLIRTAQREDLDLETTATKRPRTTIFEHHFHLPYFKKFSYNV